MSIARKRAKVKNNSPAVKKKRRKAKGSREPPKRKRTKKKRPSKPARPTKKRPQRPAKRVTHRIGKIQVSVNTKPPRKVSSKAKKAKRKQGKKRRKLTPEQLDKLIQRTISKAAKEAGVSELEVRVRAAGGTPQQIREAQFFAQPQVKLQVAERMIEKGLMDLTRGMVRTVESIILTEMILAEQRGNLHERAQELSAEYHKPIREVYEILHSPETFLDS